MATQMKQKDEPVPAPPSPEPSNSEVKDVTIVGVDDFFRREINAKTPVVHLTLKRVLTRPLISMGRTKTLIAKLTSEMYTIDLPLKGRSGGTAPARVIDIENPGTKEEGILIVHEVMASCFERGGYKVLKSKRDEQDKVTYVEKAGTPLKDRIFAFKAGDIDAEKRHRNVEVAELEQSQ